MKIKLAAIVVCVLVLSACGSNDAQLGTSSITSTSSPTTTTSTKETSSNNKEQIFLQVLKDSKYSDVYNASPDSTHLNIGNTVCRSLDSGRTLQDLNNDALRAVEQTPNVSPAFKFRYLEAAGFRMGAAIGSMCPEHTNKVPR